jgi:hypothetical protein
MKRLILTLGFVFAAALLSGGDRFKEDLDYAQVLFVRANETGSGVWQFSVTVRHRDEGWDHYADVWQIVNQETGAVIAERVLAHPHDNEQPFTRSLGGVRIPPGVDAVTVRAGCNVHGFGGREVSVPLSADSKSALYEVDKL